MLKLTTSFIISIGIIALSILWMLGWFIIAAYHCAPNAEDIAGAYAAQDQGILNFIINTLVLDYTRYTSTFFYGFNVLSLGGYRYFMLMPLVCFLALVGAFYFFISSFLRFGNRRWFLLLYSVFFILVHIAIEPSLYYGMFYMASFIDYMYPWVFTFIWAGLLIQVMGALEEKYSGFLYAISVLFLVFSMGCSELFIGINGLFLFAFFIYSLSFSKRSMKLVIAHGLVYSSCVLFIFSNPSHKVDASNILADISVRYPDSNFVVESFKSYLKFYRNHMLHPISIAFVLISVIFHVRFTAETDRPSCAKKKFLLFLFGLSTLGGYFTTWIFFIPKGTTGDFPVYIYNCVSVFAQVGLYLFLPMYISSTLFVSKRLNSRGVAEQVSLFLFLACIIILPSNFRTVLNEYKSGYLSDWKQKTDNFYLQVEGCIYSKKHPSVVYFENPNPQLSSVFYSPDILPNRVNECWNISYEDYFSVDEVRFKGDTVFKLKKTK